MPFERIDIAGTRFVLVRTRAFQSACEPGKRLLVPTREKWASALPCLLNHPPEDFTGHHQDLLKYSSTHAVMHVHFSPPIASSSFVCKRSRAAALANRLRSAVWGSRERRSFRMALRVLKMNIPTATPVALVERGRPHFDGWLLMEHVDVMRDLDHLCLTGLRGPTVSNVPRLKRAIMDGIIAMFEAFRRGGWFHRDMKASNIIIFGEVDKPSDIRVGLLDLEGLRRWGGRSRTRWRKAVVRLAASLEGYEAVTQTDRLRFLRRYLRATESSDANWKAVYRDLGRAAERYAAQSRARKEGKLDGFQ